MAENAEIQYDTRKVLRDMSFTIPEKTSTAIVGPSGSGKTTICSLLARFYDPQSGSITLGGHDLREFTCDSLLSNISMVFQNVYLFNDTIRANICFGKPDATEEEMIAAAKKAAEKGIEIVPVTGRPLSGLPQCVKVLPGVHYAVTSNQKSPFS